MILSGLEIKKELGKNIIIDPYDEKQLNPNSYNLKLNNKLIVYKYDELDMKKDNACCELVIPERGLMLRPGVLYLGRTLEYTKTENYIPMLEGRSSIGRLGLFVHITAGFGDVGFSGYWTLEISCIQPIRIYPFIEICQICYNEIKGDYISYGIKSNKYQNNIDIQSSKLYKEFE